MLTTEHSKPALLLPHCSLMYVVRINPHCQHCYLPTDKNMIEALRTYYILPNHCFECSNRFCNQIVKSSVPKQEPLRVCEYASVRVCECATVRVCECASVRVCECASVRVCDYASMRVCECASMRVCEYASVRVCECAIMRVCDYVSMWADRAFVSM